MVHQTNKTISLCQAGESTANGSPPGPGHWTLDRLVRGLFLKYQFSRFSSCGLRSQEVISVVLFLETLVLCFLFSNFKKALNQR